MDREGGNKEKMRKCREWISLHFPHSLSISFPFPPSPSIFSQPGCQAATSCATLNCSTSISQWLEAVHKWRHHFHQVPTIDVIYEQTRSPVSGRYFLINLNFPKSLAYYLMDNHSKLSPQPSKQTLRAKCISFGFVYVPFAYLDFLTPFLPFLCFPVTAFQCLFFFVFPSLLPPDLIFVKKKYTTRFSGQKF